VELEEEEAVEGEDGSIMAGDRGRKGGVWIGGGGPPASIPSGPAGLPGRGERLFDCLKAPFSRGGEGRSPEQGSFPRNCSANSFELAQKAEG